MNPKYLLRKFVLISILLLLCKPGKGQNDYNTIYISEEGLYKVLRVNVGIVNMSMQPVDSGIGYSAYGFHMLNEVKIISAFWDVDNKFTIHDGFYVDLNFGRTGPIADKTIASTYSKPRGRGAGSINMGYFCMAGYRIQPWGVLGGIDFRWRSAGVAKIKMPNLDGPLFYSSFPLGLRLEKGIDKENPNQRISLSLWSTLSDKKRAAYQSVGFEWAISDNGRWNLFGQYQRQEAMSEDVYFFTPPTRAVYKQLTFGLRVGNLP